MNKQELLALIDDVQRGWEAAIADLGAEGLERANAVGDWRVRDVLGHFNGWERWQLAQLRSAFDGSTPTDEQLMGGIPYPDNDDMQVDAMNKMMFEGWRDQPLDKVLAHYREITSIRSELVDALSQEELDSLIGDDWAGGTQRIFRLVSEVPTATGPRTATANIADQLQHQLQHLGMVRDWMSERV